MHGINFVTWFFKEQLSAPVILQNERIGPADRVAGDVCRLRHPLFSSEMNKAIKSVRAVSGSCHLI